MRPTSLPPRALDVATELAREAGEMLMRTFGREGAVSSKGDHSNVVTLADGRAEGLIVSRLRSRFPDHSIVAEESGVHRRDSPYTWVVDPLDGTSNFAAGIPWFGVLIALLHQDRPVIGVLHLPASGDCYVAETGSGTHRNGERVRVTDEAVLSNVLWAYGMDAGSVDDTRADEASAPGVRLLSRLLRRVRNVRATNSLVDAALTADGRLGGMLNHSTRLWDIAAPMLIVQEAGGRYTDVRGQPLRLDLSDRATETVYAVLAGAPALHAQVAALAAS